MKKTIHSTSTTIENQSYYYSNAILHRQGKGFCGFTQITTYDYITRDNIVQTYNPQIWGRVETMDTRDNTITYTYNTATEGYKKEPLLQIQTATTVDKVSGFTKKMGYNNYNSYNIPLSIKSTFGNDAIEETTYTYNNKVSASNYSVNLLPTVVTTKKTRGSDTFTTSAENTYNTNDLLTKEVSKVEGNITSVRELTYDVYSNVASESNMPYNQAALKTAVGYTYTNGRLLATKTNELGQKTTYTYAANSTLSKKTDYKGRTTTYEYDAFNRPIKTTYPDGTVESTKLEWTQSYNNLRSIDPNVNSGHIKLSSPISGTTSLEACRSITLSPGFSHSATKNNLSLKIDPYTCVQPPKGEASPDHIALFFATKERTGAPVTKIYYDALGREIRKGEMRFDGKYLYTDIVYDEKGNIEKTSLPYTGTSATAWNTTSFDTYDRPTSVTYASGKKDTYSYNKNVETSVIDGIKKETTTDATNRVTKIVDAAGTISYAYKASGQPNSITAPGNVLTQFTYDGYGRQTSIIDPSAGTKTFTYDAGGNVNKETDARGKVITMVYDKYNRMTEKNIDGIKTSMIYNTDGLLTKVSELQGTTNVSTKDLTYDALSRINKERTTVIDGKWLEKEYAYTNGNISSIAYLASTYAQRLITQSFAYANGHLKEILGGSVSVWKLDAENALGAPTQITTGSLTRTYGFTAHGLPTSRVVKNGNTVIQNFGYEFDPATGNLKWRKDNVRNKQENFVYDNLNRLTSLAGKTVSYDVKGNITDFATVGKFTYAAAKPYAVSEITPYGTEIPLRNQDIKYNSQMRHSEISENGQTTAFTYNNNGDRVRMISKKGTATELTRYYIGGQYELDSSVAGVDEKLYLDGDAYSASTVFMKKNGTWAFYYICRDYLGSITHVTNASGGVVQELSYDAWGRLRNPATQTNYAVGTEPPLFLGRGYTGHEHLTQYGLINMNARLYDPVIGRFLSPDPYVQAPYFSQNFNRYSYCLNNPLKYNDESGELFGFVAGFVAKTLIFNAVKDLSVNIVSKTFQSGKSWNWNSTRNAWKITEGFGKGTAKQRLSRFTWELPQTAIGYGYTQYRNGVGNVDVVKYFDGATFAINGNSSKDDGVSIGSFININQEKAYSEPNGKFDPTQENLYMHEYGHYLQSQSKGWGYLVEVGIPSIISAAKSKRLTIVDGQMVLNPTGLTTHKLRDFEVDASNRARQYFQKKYNFTDWDNTKFPTQKPYPFRTINGSIVYY